MSKYNTNNEYVQAMINSEAAKTETLLNSEYGVSIFQLGFKEGTSDLMFEPYDKLNERGLLPERKNYVMVYSYEADADYVADMDCLERVWTKFNIDRPKDFEGHSLSVSDVIVLKNRDVVSAYYVDSFGFKRIEDFSVTPKTTTISFSDEKLSKLAEKTGIRISTEQDLKTAINYAVSAYLGA